MKLKQNRSPEETSEKGAKGGVSGVPRGGFVTTTGRGRRGKAHIADGDGGTLCNRAGESLKQIDEVVADRFYELCEICERRKAEDF